MAYKIEWLEEEGLHVRFNGDVTLNEIFDANRIISNNRRYSTIIYHISDFLETENILMTKKDIESLSTFHVIPTLLNSNLKLSIVSNNPKTQKMVLEYMELMKENEWEIKLFDNLKEALAWGKGE